MKFTIENLGPIKKAPMEFGKLTILCGKNNTGKTYVTYNAYNYLKELRCRLRTDKHNISDANENNYPNLLLEKGQIIIDLNPYLKDVDRQIERLMFKWVKKDAAKEMSAHEDFYKEARMSLEIDRKHIDDVISNLSFNRPYRISEYCTITAVKRKRESKLEISLQNSAKELPPQDFVSGFVNYIIGSCLSEIVPELFILTSERTGASVFKSEFSVASREGALFQFVEAAELFSHSYPKPVRKDMALSFYLNEIVRRKSFIAKNHPQIISYFEDIVGGSYSLQDKDIVNFVPSGTTVGLTTSETSSSVRSLLGLSFYLKHLAQHKQCLIIDEPEQNLHPELQRKMARLIARLINIGIYVAVTTHSDYFVKELNTLIMLGYNDPRMEDMKNLYGYVDEEVLNSSHVKAYCLCNGSLVPMPVTQEEGIRVDSFDESIREMATIQRDILFGGKIGYESKRVAQ